MDLLAKMATYVRVVEAGSLSAAAKQLRISAAAVSRQIATLERDLHAPLLLRSTRRMVVTPAGQRYYARCLQILRDVDDAQAVTGDAIAGLLRVSAPVTYGLARIVPQLPALLAAHRGLRIDIRLEDRVVDLMLDGVDVAIRVGVAPPESTDLVAHRLVGLHRILVASPRYLKRRGEPKQPEVLARHDALSHAIDVDGWHLVGPDRNARVRGTIVARSNAGHALRTLALADAGIALLPVFFVVDELRAGTLRHVLPAWQSEPITVYALHRTAQRGEARIRALLDHLRDTL